MMAEYKNNTFFKKDYSYILETDNCTLKFQKYHFEGRSGQDGGVEGT